MPSNLVVDAIRPAWQRAAKLIFAPASWLRVAIVFVILAVERPGIELPPFVDRWFSPPEMDSYNREWSALAFSPTVRLLSITGGVILGIVFVVLLLMFIFRAPFMRFDLLVRRRGQARELWRENGGLAFQWFLFGLCVGFVQESISGLLGLVPHTSNAWWLLGLIRLKDFAWPFVVATSYWLADDFLVPVLSLEGGTVLHAMEYAWSMLRPNLLEFLRYLAMKTALVLLSSVAIVPMIALGVRLLIAPLVGLILHLLQKNSVKGITHFSFEVVLAVFVAFVVSLLMLMIWALIEGAISAFFGSYAVLFFADRYPSLSELLNDEHRITA